MDYENMSGAAIGREFAPENVADKGGWGRRLLKQAKEFGETVKAGLEYLGVIGYGGYTQAEVMAEVMADIKIPDVKAPHAYRGTPPRKHFSRYTRTPRAFRA